MKNLLKEINRLKTAIILILFGLIVWGIKEFSMTISLILSFIGITLVIGHIVSKELFSKYNWDVGMRLNTVWLLVKHTDIPSDKILVLAILAVAMLLARILIYCVIVLSLTLLVCSFLRGSAFGDTYYSSKVEPPPSHILNILKEEHKKLWAESDIYILMGQIKAESNWRETAMRKEPSGVISYGLFQVLDVTLKDMQKKHEIIRDIEPVQMLQARYSIRAGILYDINMWKLTTFASDYINHWAFALSAYNGGYGWLLRDRKLAEANNHNKNVWFDNVEKFSNRSKIAFRINRAYPVKIFKYAEMYRKIGDNCQKL